MAPKMSLSYCICFLLTVQSAAAGQGMDAEDSEFPLAQIATSKVLQAALAIGRTGRESTGFY